MRIALISDIHGNLVSLEAVLADIEREAVDQVVCLGDVGTLGPQPREVITWLKRLNCICVMGNHDSILLDPSLGKAYMDEAWFADIVEWCTGQLIEEDFDYLRTFSPLVSLQLGDDTTLLCFHGSPKSNIDTITAVTPPKKLNQLLAGHKATIMAGGHTHVQMVRLHEGMMILNAGSVGMPFREMPFKGTPHILPWAEYAIVACLDGVLKVDLRRVSINLEAVKEAAFTSGMPDPAGWASNWVDNPLSGV